MDGRYVKLPPIQKERPDEERDDIFRPESTPPHINASRMAFRKITATDLAQHLQRQEEDVDLCRKQLLSQQQLISRLLGNLNKERRENLRLKTENDERERQSAADDDDEKTAELLKELENTRKELKITETKLKEKNSELTSAAQRIEILQKENKERDEIIFGLQCQMATLHSKVDEQQTTIDEMKERLSDYNETKSELAAIREQLKEVMEFQISRGPNKV